MISGVKSRKTLSTSLKKYKIRQLNSNISNQSEISLILSMLQQKITWVNTFIKVLGRQSHYSSMKIAEKT